MTNKNETICKNHFRGQGYRCHSKKRLVSYIEHEFFMLKKGKDLIALYIFNPKKESIHNLLDSARSCSINDLNIKICVCIPNETSIPSTAREKIDGTSIELHIINDGVIEPYLIASEIRILEEKKIRGLRNLLEKINVASNINYGFPLFKINKKMFDKICLIIKTEKDFVYQIQTLLSIIEALEYKQMLDNLKKLSETERRPFLLRQSISAIEVFFKKKKINLNRHFQKTTQELRNLRDLRNMPPTHPTQHSSKYKTVCKKYIGHQPKTTSDWKRLNQICLLKFEESLKILRDCMLRK